MTYSLEQIDEYLSYNRDILINYCKDLSEKYNKTLSGNCRIEYNLLYPLLFDNLEPAIKIKFFSTFINSKSLRIYI
jgi:hypothetical protein